MQKFNKHIVGQDQTLKSIAALYNLPVEELKRFHNNHCEVRDMILITLTDQKELFLPRTAVADKSRLVPFGHGNTLMFQPEDVSCRYGVIIIIENGNTRNELKYETMVRWLKSENHLHYFEVDRIPKLYLNEEEVNEIADLLAYKTSKVLYPLQVSTDRKGKLQSIENGTAFKERWPGIKKEVFKEFGGETVEGYCLKMEEILQEPEKVSLLMKNDYFLRTLFFGIYQGFGRHYKTEEIENFPVVNNPVEANYRIALEIDPVKDEYDQIQLEGYGTLYDERSASDFISRFPFSPGAEQQADMNTDGSFRMQYYLNGQTSFPESMYLECSIKLTERKKVSVVIAKIDDE
ncbi:hypothetical protein [uncultured Chryseobacterium sp.]|uniref:hypothetical protein n=1 Tax=uncultured Chryseobacterium sp. TaxID=259322 RepID=UPI0025E119A3|nr:hypothetical protein [uncultured Chryseobacterium sp.]